MTDDEFPILNTEVYLDVRYLGGQPVFTGLRQVNHTPHAGQLTQQIMAAMTEDMLLDQARLQARERSK